MSCPYNSHMLCSTDEMLSAFEHMEAKKFATSVIVVLGCDNLSEVYPHRDDVDAQRVRQAISTVMKVCDPVQRETVLALSRDRARRKLAGERGNK